MSDFIYNQQLTFGQLKEWVLNNQNNIPDDEPIFAIIKNIDSVNFGAGDGKNVCGKAKNIDYRIGYEVLRKGKWVNIYSLIIECE